MNPAGNFIVVWNSYLQDGSSNGVFAQLFDPNCTPVGEEFQVNTTAAGNQKEQSVAINTGGGFVVVWQGPAPAKEDKEDIFAMRYDPNGLPVGTEFRVNTGTIDKQICPAAAMNQNGGFVIVWESANVPVDGKKSICGRLFDRNGQLIGDEFIVNEGTSDGRYPDVAMDNEGNFAVVWMEDRSSNAVLGRLYSPDGSAKTEPFEISSSRFSSVTQPAIAMNIDGRFVVVWDGHPDLAKEDDIHARIFDPNAAALGDQFIVNTTAQGPQQNPDVALNNRGWFIVVWDNRIDPEINERDIFARRFDSTGIPLGDEFQTNPFVEGDQKRPAVAVSDGRGFVAVWQSDGRDGSGYGVFAHMGRIVASADFNGDGVVDFADYCILAARWHRIGDALTADLTEDFKIDKMDLAEFSYQWLETRD
jgi:hypothetical protein